MAATHLLEYFKWMYGTQSDIYAIASEKVELYKSQKGVRQGDMPASLLFSLVFTDAAIAAAQDKNLSSDISEKTLHSLWLYMDDVTMVATVADVIVYKRSLSRHLVSIGLALNMKKCRVLADRCTEEEVVLLVAEGFQLDYGCTRVLGSPIGTKESCRDWVLTKVEGWKLFWERLRNPRLHPSTALTILKICGNVKFEHLARSLSPDVVHLAACSFDACVEDTALRILNTKYAKVSPHVVRGALLLVPYATISSILFKSTCTLIDEGVVVDARWEINTAIRAEYAKLSLPPFVELQLSAAQGLHADAVITPTTTINHQQYVHGWQLRCGVAELHVPSSCSCGHDFDTEGVFRNGHLLTCHENTKKTMTTRHDGIALAIQRVLSVYMVNSFWAPHYLSASLIPDLHISSFINAIVDVTVSDSVLQMDRDLLIARAKEKHLKYDSLAELHRYKFYALVIDTYGAMHGEFDKFIDDMSREMPRHLRGGFCREMRSAIQLALLRGNAEIAEQAVLRLNKRHGVWC